MNKEKQAIFEKCLDLYDFTLDNIKSMTETVIRIAKENPDFNVEIDLNVVLSSFDVVLQYSLLQFATADNEIDKDEVAFIKDLTKHGDFIDFVNKVSGSSLTWAKLVSENIYDFKNTLQDFEDIMEDVSNHFVVPFAYCDAFTEYNYNKDFREHVELIIYGLCLMDGSADEAEVKQRSVILGAISRIDLEKEKLLKGFYD